MKSINFYKEVIIIKVNEIKKVCIAGAGTMGSTIAQIFAQKDYNVILYDISNDSISRGMEIIENNLFNMKQNNMINSQKITKIKTNIKSTTDINMISNSHFVLEAIVEDLKVKQDFWKKVSNLVSEKIILASNTSGLSITKIAKYLDNKERFGGMHWWNPPHLIPLVEVVKGDKTSEKTANNLMQLAKKLGKKPVLVKKDVPGFIGNRLQYALLREALYLIEENIAKADDVDKAMRYGLGLRYSAIGPIETVDLGGVDIFASVGSYLFEKLNNKPELPKIIKRLNAENKLGIKTGEGFYNYKDDEDNKLLERRDSHLIKFNKYLFNEKPE